MQKVILLLFKYIHMDLSFQIFIRLLPIHLAAMWANERRCSMKHVNLIFESEMQPELN